jgi:magnesium chelatase subunit I
VLLGERGQGKTRLIRTIVQLLDAETPVVAGCEINDHPVRTGVRPLPAARSPSCGDDLPVQWKPASSATARSWRRRTPLSAT